MQSCKCPRGSANKQNAAGIAKMEGLYSIGSRERSFSRKRCLRTALKGRQHLHSISENSVVLRWICSLILVRLWLMWDFFFLPKVKNWIISSKWTKAWVGKISIHLLFALLLNYIAWLLMSFQYWSTFCTSQKHPTNYE